MCSIDFDVDDDADRGTMFRDDDVVVDGDNEGAGNEKVGDIPNEDFVSDELDFVLVIKDGDVAT